MVVARGLSGKRVPELAARRPDRKWRVERGPEGEEVSQAQFIKFSRRGEGRGRAERWRTW